MLVVQQKRQQHGQTQNVLPKSTHSCPLKFKPAEKKHHKQALTSSDKGSNPSSTMEENSEDDQRGSRTKSKHAQKHVAKHTQQHSPKSDIELLDMQDDMERVELSS